MTALLAIDTSTSRCAVAVSIAGKLYKRLSEQARQSAQKVLPMVNAVLDEAGVGLGTIDAIAVVSGPGSFTGLRIGIGAAQGLSMANATPVVAISSLALLAKAGHRLHGGEHWLVCTRARDDEVYFGAYTIDSEGQALPLQREQVAAPLGLTLALDEIDPSSCWMGIGDGWGYQSQIEQALAVQMKACYPESNYAIEDLCELAALRFQRGEAVAAELVLPNYVKEHMDYS